MTPQLADEHSLLLWQTCAYADAVIAAAESGQRLTPPVEAMLGFLHGRLLPYLDAEERRLSVDGLRDAHLARVLLADHDRLRADAENVEGSSTRRLLVFAAGALVDRLGRHVQREESWVTGGPGGSPGPDEALLPLLAGGGW